ncbi:MAG TPA: hypothetical protein EYP10_13705, partial [Armatimonadetes bacterium]|nr:hypothetical protein [Armatimonadota bacterium]
MDYDSMDAKLMKLMQWMIPECDCGWEVDALMQTFQLVALYTACAVTLLSCTVVRCAIKVTVEVEEVISTCGNPKNGAWALWCYGAPLIVRVGKRTFASIMEVGTGIPPLCNTRPRIFMRDERGWRIIWHADEFREREPCPLACFHNGILLLSVNPLINIAESRRGACKPHLLRFSLRKLDAPPKILQPKWVD